MWQKAGAYPAWTSRVGSDKSENGRGDCSEKFLLKTVIMVTAMLMMVVTVENGGDGELDDSENSGDGLC